MGKKTKNPAHREIPLGQKMKIMKTKHIVLSHRWQT